MGPKGKIYIFELIEVTYAMLVKNVYLNQLEDITTAYKMGTSNAYSNGVSEMIMSNMGAPRSTPMLRTNLRIGLVLSIMKS